MVSKNRRKKKREQGSCVILKTQTLKGKKKTKENP